MSNTRQGSDYDYSGRRLVAFSATTFAAILLALVAIFQILDGIAAIASDQVYVKGIDYTYKLDVTSWGWIHLVIGLVALATAIGILMGQVWGRIMGIVIASVSVISNFMFLPYYPFWSLTVIAFDVFIIWALCSQIAHDDRV